MQYTWILSPDQEDPLEKKMATTLVFLPGKFCGQRGLAGHQRIIDCSRNNDLMSSLKRKREVIHVAIVTQEFCPLEYSWGTL